MLCGIAVAGFTGYAIGKLSFRVRGAYFVIVSISFAEVVRLVAVNWVELTQGPMALNNIPPLRLGAMFFGRPRPLPAFSPPPDSAFTVAQARAFAVLADTPRSSSGSNRAVASLTRRE